MKTQNRMKKQTHLKVISMLLAIALIVPLLTTSTPTEVYAKTTTTKVSKSMYVKQDNTKKYSKPDTKKQMKGHLKFNQKLWVVNIINKGSKGIWYTVKTSKSSKSIFYVKKAALTSIKQATVVVKDYKKTMYTTGTNVKLRKSPIQGNNQKASIKSKGTKVQVIGKVTRYHGSTKGATNWYKCKVTVAGKSYTGYIHRDNLTTTKPKNSSSSNNNGWGDLGDMSEASDHGSDFQ